LGCAARFFADGYFFGAGIFVLNFWLAHLTLVLSSAQRALVGVLIASALNLRFASFSAMLRVAR
jgi:hypothetical protein